MSEDIALMLLDRVKMYENFGYTKDQALLFGLMEEITHINYTMYKMGEVLDDINNNLCGIEDKLNTLVTWPLPQ